MKIVDLLIFPSPSSTGLAVGYYSCSCLEATCLDYTGHLLFIMANKGVGRMINTNVAGIGCAFFCSILLVQDIYDSASYS